MDCVLGWEVTRVCSYHACCVWFTGSWGVAGRPLLLLCCTSFSWSRTQSKHDEYIGCAWHARAALRSREGKKSERIEELKKKFAQLNRCTGSTGSVAPTCKSRCLNSCCVPSPSVSILSGSPQATLEPNSTNQMATTAQPQKATHQNPYPAQPTSSNESAQQRNHHHCSAPKPAFTQRQRPGPKPSPAQPSPA
jgi:hypothetical protein